MTLRLVRIALVASIALIGAAPWRFGFPLVTRAEAACDPGTVIDKTTVEETRAKLSKAGYQNPSRLRKGCDNAWHGTATKDGQQVDVAVLPDGHIVRDGD